MQDFYVSLGKQETDLLGPLNHSEAERLLTIIVEESINQMADELTGPIEREACNA